ncbi:MAG: HEAT repeat domain-containing protein [Gemmataceae bacterium]|nr:HEAT repeat domain-containing protein [Gemmataceae bacterium]
MTDDDKVRIFLSLIDAPEPEIRRFVADHLLSFDRPEVAQGLIILLNDPDDEVFDRAANGASSLDESGRAMIPALKAILQQAQPARRLRALQSLTYACVRNHEWLKELSMLLDDDDIAIRVEATRLVCDWSRLRHGKTCVPKLVQMLQDVNPECRIEAAYSLCCFVKGSKEGLSVLSSGLLHSETKVRRKAAHYLYSLSDAKAAFPELARAALADPDPEVRQSAISALGYCGKPALPILTRLFNSDEGYRYWAAVSLGRLGTDAAEIAAQLLEQRNGIRDGDQVVFGALRAIKAASIVPDLMAMLNEKDVSLRKLVINVLGETGLNARASVPVLLPLLEHADDDLQLEAAAALAKMGEVNDRILSILTTGLMISKEKTVHGIFRSIPALEAFDKIGSGARSTIPELRKMLEAEEVLTRANAGTALGCIGPDAKEAVPDLIRAMQSLQGKDKRYGTALTEAFGKIKASSEAVVPLLKQELRSPYLYNQKAAILALGRFGPQARAAIPDLLPLLDDDREDIAEAAAAALAQIDPERFAVKSAR